MSVLVGKPRVSTRHASFGELVHDRLGAAEVRRRAHHMLPGLIPLVLWVLPHPHRWIVALAVGAAVVAGAIVTFIRFHCIQRAEEGQTDCIIAVTSYAGSILATLILFAPRVEVAFLVLGVFAFGDGSATLGGMLFGRKPLPWNKKKTIVGTACFLLIGAPLAAFLYGMETRNFWASAYPSLASPTHPVAFGAVLAIAGVTTLAAAIAESLPSRTNDNLRVGVTAAVAASVMQMLLVGWN
jgi:phytol kinase